MSLDDTQEKMKVLKVRLELYVTLKALAQFRNQTMQDVLEELLESVDPEEYDEISLYNSFN